jgi:hypothetical protein
MATTSWLSPSPASKYGGAFVSPPPATKDDSPLVQVAGPPPGRGQTSFLHPDPAMLWIGAVLAAAVGFAAVSTTVRVGPVKADVKVGAKG